MIMTPKKINRRGAEDAEKNHVNHENLRPLSIHRGAPCAWLTPTKINRRDAEDAEKKEDNFHFFVVCEAHVSPSK
jgi:hypothetical protein